jgi:hypothetical protein
MRVSLVIDGDAKGAEQAAGKTSAAIGDLGRQTDAISKAIEDGFNKAVGAMNRLGESTRSGGAANDNFKGALLGVVGQLDAVAEKAAGADSALGKTSSGVANVAKGVAGLSLGAGTIGLLSGAIGIAVTVATTLFGILNSGAAESNKRLEESARLVGVVRDAYRDAARTAGDFYAQSNAITELQAQQSLIALQAEQKKSAGIIVNRLAPTDLGPLSGSLAGEAGVDGGLAGLLFPDSTNEKMRVFAGAFDALKAGIAVGSPDIEKFRDDIAAIGNAAQAANPAVAALAADILKQTDAAGQNALALRKSEAVLAMLNGTASEAQKRLLGVATQTGESANQFDRFARALERQAASLEAEAAATGKSAGEAAKMRAQFLLTEAAQQSGIKVAGDYADRLDKIASRFGAASQKAAEFRLASDAAINTSQLGRSSIEASVASQLRGAYGDNADMNSAIAETIRFNEQMKELKATTIEITQGAFHDFRTELNNGATAWEAFQKAGMNALQKIEDKLADKAIEGLVSNLFGSFLGSGSTGGIFGGLFGNGSLPKFDVGGYTGDGSRQDVAGIVHGREFVVNADATARHLPLLRAINANRLPGYESGGFVGTAPQLSYASGSQGQNAGQVTNLYIQTTDPRSFAEDRVNVMRGLNRMMARAQRYT